MPDYVKSYDLFSNKKVIKDIINFIRLSDCLWAVNKNIVTKYGRNFSKAVVNDAPVLFFDGAFDKFCKKTEDKVIIGYSGGCDHEYILDMFLDKPIDIILGKYGNKIEFQFFGAKPMLVQKHKLCHIPYKINYEDYKNTMKSLNWDIGIAPIEKSSFTSCKYYNKFLEYGATGAAGIYTNAEPYTNVVCHQDNGILVENTVEAWVEALNFLIENPEARNKIQKNAYRKIEDEFTLEKVSEKVIKNMPEIINYKA